MKNLKKYSKNLLIFLFSIISIFSLSYFTVKYYFEGSLNFDNKNIVAWTILVIIILIALILGIVNYSKLNSVLSQNTVLYCLLVKTLDRQNDNQEEIITTLLNSREITLDTYNEIIKKENRGK